MNVTLVTCTHGGIRNSIKKSRLDRIENGHHRRGCDGDLSPSLGIIKNSASYLRAAYRPDISRMEGS